MGNTGYSSDMVLARTRQLTQLRPLGQSSCCGCYRAKDFSPPQARKVTKISVVVIAAQPAEVQRWSCVFVFMTRTWIISSCPPLQSPCTLACAARCSDSYNLTRPANWLCATQEANPVRVRVLSTPRQQGGAVVSSPSCLRFSTTIHQRCRRLTSC